MDRTDLIQHLARYHKEDDFVFRGQDALDILEEMLNPNHPNRISDEKMQKMRERHAFYKNKQKQRLQQKRLQQQNPAP